LAKCCHPLPGVPVVGIVTKRRLISVHTPGCRAALKEQDRWVEVSWKESFNRKIRFNIMAIERSGVLADLLHTIASAGFEVSEAKAKLIDLAHAQCSFLVVPRSLDRLTDLIERVNNVNGVQRIYFE
jgi:GTP pyrophosphokinase